ncbi:MAG: hypothetical protein M1829_006398 [Trizodia sp. TS-e1964]|nr:MAG: hypothetical protein M1829_006398 [Trizodia sp. TS-e1964]
MALPLKSRLSDDFLAQTPNITKIPIDFSQTALPEYAGLYAVVLENVLTKAECDALVSAAEASNEAGWEPAMINVGGGRQRLVIDQRKCGRIIWDSPEIAARLWNRVRPLVPEIELLDKSSDAHKTKRNLKKHSWEATRLNERLRFLKYGAGDYFKRKSIRYVDDLTAESPE